MNFLCIKYQHILLKRKTTTEPMTNIYTNDGPIPPHTRPGSLVVLLPIHPLRPPRMIHLLHRRSRPFVSKTPDPQTKLMPIYWLALQFGISQLYSIECPSGPLPPTVTNPDLPVLLYNMLWLVYTIDNCSILENHLAWCIYLLVSSLLHYLVLFCLLIHSPWLKLMIDTLMNGVINR